MADTEISPIAPAQEGWMSDVQRALAIILVATFAAALLLMVVRVTFWGDIPTVADILKILIPALINVVTFVLGYFYGSSKAKEAADAGQQKIVDKLTSPTPPAGAPAAPTVVVSWWSLLTAPEQAAIEAAAPADARVAAILTALKTGKAEAPDLADLVAKGLLTQTRADMLKGV